MAAKTNKFIFRCDFDENIYFIGYSWRNDNGKLFKRIAATIHVDDIEGVFGEAVYEKAVDIIPGSNDSLD
jgi:hypothetical protein